MDRNTVFPLLRANPRVQAVLWLCNDTQNELHNEWGANRFCDGHQLPWASGGCWVSCVEKEADIELSSAQQCWPQPLTWEQRHVCHTVAISSTIRTVTWDSGFVTILMNDLGQSFSPFWTLVLYLKKGLSLSNEGLWLEELWGLTQQLEYIKLMTGFRHTS